MNRLTILAGLLLLATISNSKSLKNPSPTSALAYQQATDTRIAVEAGYIRFYTNAIQRLTIDNIGNVGIGVGPNTDRLSIEDASDNQINMINTTGNSWQFRVGNSGSLIFRDDNVDRVRIDENGNVGIGTTNPTSVLDIKTSSGSLKVDALGASSAKISSTAALGLEANASSFIQFLTGGSEIGRFTNEGKFGIGITNPDSELQVSGGNADEVLWPISASNTRNTSAVTNYGVGLKLRLSGNHEAYKWGGIASIQEGSWANNSALALYANESEKVRIMSDGKVGIGTTSPVAKLHVVSNGVSSFTSPYWSDDAIFENNDHSGITIVSPSDKVGHILFGNPSNNDAARIHFQHDANKMEFAVQGVKAVTIDGNQKVGIGTTDPSYKLHVAGKIKGTYFYGDRYYAGGVQVWPDYVFEDTYQLNDLKDVEKFIEKNHHLPEIPSEADVKEKGIDLVEMQAKLLQKIEELTLYVIEQNKRMDELSKENNDYRQRIEKLEKNKL